LTVKGGTNSAWDDAPLLKAPDTIVYRSPIYVPLLAKSTGKPKPKARYTGVTVENQAARSEPASPIRRLRRFAGSLIRIPDEINFWIPLGLVTGLRAIRRENVAAIVSSSPPASGHILASLISRLSGCPHVVDFRDLWTLNHTYVYRGFPPSIKKLDATLERWVLKRAERIVTASPGFEVQMRSHLGGSLADRLVTITNGFDYAEIDREREIVPADRTRMRILYTGSLYSDFNPVFFFECLAEWIKNSKIDPATIAVDFYGNSEYDYSEFLNKLGLGQAVVFHGFVPHAELLPKVEQADYLLLLLSFKNQHAPVIPAKLFEYLASPARIIALTPEGTTADLIAKYRAGEVLCQADRPKMIAMLDGIYNEWRETNGTPRRYRYIREIDREYLAERLAGELDRLTESRR
jgi:glycosyltransferase involved in cell wall biosynthesis